MITLIHKTVCCCKPLRAPKHLPRWRYCTRCRSAYFILHENIDPESTHVEVEVY